MYTSILFNFITGLIALALSSSVALHDSRFDKVFAMAAAPGDETAQRDFGQAVSHELHVHDGSQTITGAPTDPLARARSHRKYTALPHVRVRLAALKD